MNDESNQTEKLATSRQRLANYLIDLIFCIILVLTCKDILDNTRFAELFPLISQFLLPSAVVVAYYTIQESLFGLSIGKLITGTRAVGEDGSDLTPTKAFRRSMCRLIPFEQFSFLDKKQPKGWHDRIPDTKVITIR